MPIDVERWRLTGGGNIPWIAGCTIKQPRLRQILTDSDDGCIGFDAYTAYVGILSVDIFELIPGLSMSKETLGISPFQFLIADSSLRDMTAQALSFFIEEDIVACDGFFRVMRDGEEVGIIGDDEFPTVRYGILRVCHIEIDDPIPPKFANKKAEETYYKILAGRKKSRGKKSDKDMNLPNMLEALVAQTPLTYDKALELTIYQFYNMFTRVYTAMQTSIIGTRWAAYGEDDFDFSIFYKDVEEKKKF